MQGYTHKCKLQPHKWHKKFHGRTDAFAYSSMPDVRPDPKYLLFQGGFVLEKSGRSVGNKFLGKNIWHCATASRVDMTRGSREKPLKNFRCSLVKPRPSHCNSAMLKKLAVYLRKFEPFRCQLWPSKDEERLRCVGRFAKTGWKRWRSWNGLRGLGNWLWLANRCRLVKRHRRSPQEILQG